MTLVYAITNRGGGFRLECETVATIEEAARHLIEQRVHDTDARLFDAAPISNPWADDDLLAAEHLRLEREQYARLREKYGDG